LRHCSSHLFRIVAFLFFDAKDIASRKFF